MAQQQNGRRPARRPNENRSQQNRNQDGRPQGSRPQQRRRPAQRPTQGRTQRPTPAHAAHARPAAASRKSIWPIAIIALVLVFAGLLVFFFLRSCGKPSDSQQAAQNTEAAAGAENQSGDAQQGNGGQDNAQQAAATNPDGSVDINLLMVGDILMHYQVRQSGLNSDGTRNYDHVFEHVLDELKNKDIKVLNQETPIAGPIYEGGAPDGYDGYPEFNGPQEIGDAEVKAGFNVALKATNHAMDNSGISDDPYLLVKAEQDFWAEKHPEMNVIGEANPNDSNTSASDVYVFEKDGFKVALLNYTQDLNGNEARDSKGMISMLEKEHVAETMAKAREMADMIVVFPHWGEEYNLEPVEMQKKWAQTFVDEGADVIIGNHPHVIEPVEAIKGEDGKVVPCYWSTGNFISTSPSSQSLVGGIAEVTLHKDKDGACSVTSAQFKPVVTHLGMSTDMTTYLITDWTDELASTNTLNTDVNPDTDNTDLTPKWANEFCTQVLGSGYDSKTGTFTLDLQ